MLSCSPKCPTLRRQIREEVKKSGWTDEYIRNIVDVQRVDIAEDRDRKVKQDPRKRTRGVPLDSLKSVTEDSAIEHEDRYEERPKRTDHPSKIVQNSIRITDYKEVIDKDDIPLASLKQETIYYTEEKEIARVPSPTFRRIIPEEVSRPRIPKETKIQSPTEGQTYEEEQEDDTSIIYSRIDHKESSRTPSSPPPPPPPPPPDSKITAKEQERPRIDEKVDDKIKIKRRDDSPDNYYKYTPKELPSDWPNDACDEACLARVLKEHAEKLLREKKKDHRYLTTGLSYFDDVCTCSLSCMIHNLRKDRFVRSILTSAILFSFGIKLCSELHGWYIPNRT